MNVGTNPTTTTTTTMSDSVAPERVKQLFSSFLSSFSQEKSKVQIDSHNIEDKTPTKDETSVLDARNKTLFYDRVESYSALTWFAKPLDLSPLVCARYGWRNIETDMLQCVNCRSMLSGQLPKAVVTQVYRESCNRLKKSLTESHASICKWSTNPCPESFMRVPYDSRDELASDFCHRLASFVHTGTWLPLVTYSSFNGQIMPRLRKISAAQQSKRHREAMRDKRKDELDFSEGKKELLSSFTRRCLRPLVKNLTEDKLELYMKQILSHCKHMIQEDIPTHIALFALCGWSYSESQVGILQCNYCRRKVGLWNYNHADDSAGSSNGNSASSECIEDQPDTDTEPDKKRPKIEKQYFDPIEEHRYWCPWLQASSLSLFNKQPNKRTSPHVSPLKSPPSNKEQLQFSSSDKVQDTETQKVPAWWLVAKILNHYGMDTEDEDSFCRQMKMSPHIDSLRHLRRVLRDCTSPTSPPKLGSLSPSKES